jgi:hypothetical protein
MTGRQDEAWPAGASGKALHLLPGVSGFGAQSHPRIDPKHFRSACHGVARIAKREVVRFEEQRYPRSFHAATLTGHEDTISILCNIAYPWIAFTAAEDHAAGPLSFVDDDQLANALRTEIEFEPLPRRWLDAHLDDGLLAGLGREERAQIDYWRRFGPLRVGDVIYNCWD